MPQDPRYYPQPVSWNQPRQPAPPSAYLYLYAARPRPAQPPDPAPLYAPYTLNPLTPSPSAGPRPAPYGPFAPWIRQTAQPYTPPKDDLDRFLQGKQRFLAKSVQDIALLLHERLELNQHHLHAIDGESLLTRNRLLDIETWRTGANPLIDKTRSNLERELQSFERDKRMEAAACWRDVARLRAELRDALGQWSQEQRRDRLLTGPSP